MKFDGLHQSLFNDISWFGGSRIWAGLSWVILLLHLGLLGDIQLADDMLWKVLDRAFHMMPGAWWGWLETWAQLGLLTVVSMHGVTSMETRIASLSLSSMCQTSYWPRFWGRGQKLISTKQYKECKKPVATFILPSVCVHACVFIACSIKHLVFLFVLCHVLKLFFSWSGHG